MKKKNVIIILALILIVILAYGIIAMGWFGLVKKAPTTPASNAGGRISFSTITCSKTMESLRENVNDLQASLNVGGNDIGKLQMAANCLQSILYILPNCFNMSRMVSCRKALDDLNANVNYLRGSSYGVRPTAAQFQAVANGITQVLYVLQYCLRTNGNTLCTKTMDGLHMNSNNLQASLNNNPPIAVQFQTAANALMQINYIIRNCITA